MLALALIVVSIGLVDSLNPGTIAPALYFATSARPVRNALAFAAGVFAVNLVAGVALLFGVGRFAGVPHPGAGIKQTAELLLGTGALVGAVWLWRVRDRIRARYAQAATRADRAALLVGVVITGLELPTAVPYFAVIAAVAGSGANITFQFALLAIFNFVFVAPVLLIAGLAAVGSDASTTRMEKLRTRVITHVGGLLSGLLFVLAIALLLVGATGIAR